MVLREGFLLAQFLSFSSLGSNHLLIIEILRIFSTENSKWTTVHKFGNDSTSISFENSNNSVKIYVSGYSKYMKFPETKLFHDLLKHIYHEKIEKSTGFVNNHKNYEATTTVNQINQNQDYQNYQNYQKTQIEEVNSTKHLHDMENTSFISERETEREKKMELNPEIDENSSHNHHNPEEWFKALKVKDEFRLVPGEIINRSEKALRFQILGKSEIWIPNSCASNDMDPYLQGIWIKEWFLKRKLDDIFQSVAG